MGARLTERSRIFFGLSYIRAHSMRDNNQILLSDQTRCEENFTGSRRLSPLLWHKILVTRTLTLDLFAVAKLFVVIGDRKNLS